MNTGEGDQRRFGLSASPELALWGSLQLKGTAVALEKKTASNLGTATPSTTEGEEPQGKPGQASWKRLQQEGNQDFSSWSQGAVTPGKG